ncbi:MAG: hypothetical protein JRJ87_25850 [Deltaproteobacteria bacterium]|nr:hypothetical protein [Deltaproteobacteria bacterium]
MQRSPSTSEPLDPAFERDKFLLRQKLLAISEKYFVFDENNKPILFAMRPAKTGAKLLAVFGGLFVMAIIIYLAISITTHFKDPTTKAMLVGSSFVVGLFGWIIVAVALSPKRHLKIFKDESRREELIEVKQINKFQLFKARYEIYDNRHNLLARLQKNYLHDFFRKRWTCFSPDGSILCTVKEDSIMLSLLRRMFGTLLGALRTNYVFLTGTLQSDVVGKFDRKFTIFDRYVLDMTADQGHLIDRRIAVAIGVMLDTGEKR